MSDAELALTLAGLRCLQEELQAYGNKDVMSRFPQLEGYGEKLDGAAIDELCERLNCSVINNKTQPPLSLTAPFIELRLTQAELGTLLVALTADGRDNGVREQLTHRYDTPGYAGYVDKARQQEDDDLMIDEPPPISVVDEGAWVGCWMFVAKDG